MSFLQGVGKTLQQLNQNKNKIMRHEHLFVIVARCDFILLKLSINTPLGNCLLFFPSRG